MVELRRPGVGNRHGRGSRIELTGPGGPQTRWIFAGGGFQSSSTPTAHFGVPGSGPVTLRITWDDGLVRTLRGVATGRRLVVERDAAP
ncbi:MAG: ASPIC/UnbV domain-containing protein [Planctomycetota bacterium]